MELEDLRALVARLEGLQAQQRSPQQPSPEIDAELARVLAGRPELRPRLAVLTKSAALRKKILTQIPEGCRAVGSSMLGSTHPWRQGKVPDSFTDHNWPKAVMTESGVHQLPGGTAAHDRLLRCPVEKLAMHPLLSHTPNYSVPRAQRFDGIGEVGRAEALKKATPGPGAYFKSEPRGPAFSVDGGETMIVGANHVCPWKKCMGHNINPVFADATSLTSAPCFSFSRTRRTVSETAVGVGCQDGGPVKTDLGGLSPGPVYEFHSSMRPLAGAGYGGAARSLALRRRARSSASLPRVRMEPVAPEEPLRGSVDPDSQ